MLKRIALTLSVCICLLGASVAMAGPGRAGSADSDSTTKSARGSSSKALTIQRLLERQLRLSIDLFRSLSGADQPNEATSGFGKLTIVDEPDPFNNSRDGEKTEPGEDSDDTEERRRAEEEGANPNTQPYQSLF